VREWDDEAALFSRTVLGTTSEYSSKMILPAGLPAMAMSKKTCG